MNASTAFGAEPQGDLIELWHNSEYGRSTVKLARSEIAVFKLLLESKKETLDEIPAEHSDRNDASLTIYDKEARLMQNEDAKVDQIILLPIDRMIELFMLGLEIPKAGK